MRLLLLALATMFIQQTIATIGRVVVPIISPAIIDDLGVGASLVGLYTALVAAAGMTSAMGCGGFILRYGPLRMSQFALVLVAAGLGAGISGMLPVIALGALTIGIGSTVSTPASSHLLSRYAPPAYAPLVFSIKQTAVPAAFMLVGLLGPLLVVHFGWRTALGATVGAALALALLLQPLRAAFDRDRDPAQPLSLSDFGTTLRAVLGDPALRVLAVAGFSYSGLQAVYSSYSVLFLTKAIGFSLTSAGLVFSTAVAVSVPARIFWGWISIRFLAPRLVLAGLGLVMTAAAALTGLYGAAWPLAAILAVAVLFSATAISWHGVLLSEVARLAPAGKVGAMTGGILGFTGAGQMALPLAFGGLLAASGSYRLGFFLLGLPALATGLVLAAGRAGASAAAPRGVDIPPS